MYSPTDFLLRPFLDLRNCATSAGCWDMKRRSMRYKTPISGLLANTQTAITRHGEQFTDAQSNGIEWLAEKVAFSAEWWRHKTTKHTELWQYETKTDSEVSKLKQHVRDCDTCIKTSIPWRGLWGLAGLKMPIHVHFFGTQFWSVK